MPRMQIGGMTTIAPATHAAVMIAAIDTNAIAATIAEWTMMRRMTRDGMNKIAGTCRYYSDGGYDRQGHVRQYGEPNAGFERYPGMGERPVFERREGP
jgi:hypothetical protein